MIKTAFKTFFRNLVYLFVPMGIVYLFVLAAVFFFLTALFNDLGATIGELSELLRVSVESSSTDVNAFLAYAIEQIDWGNFMDALRQIVETDWLTATVEGFFETLNVATEGFGDGFLSIVKAFGSRTVANLAVAIAFCALGVFLAVFATRLAVRKRSARRGVKKFLIAHTVVPVAEWATIVVFVLLLSVIRLYSVLVAVAMAIFSGFLSLLSAWLIHRDKGLKLRDVVTGGNLVSYIAVAVIFLLFNAALAVGLWFFNPLFAVLLMVPVAIYSFCIVDMNTEAYVLSLVEGARRPSAEKD